MRVKYRSFGREVDEFYLPSADKMGIVVCDCIAGGVDRIGGFIVSLSFN